MSIKHVIATALLAVAFSYTLSAGSKTYTLKSPSGELSIEINTGEQTFWSVAMRGTKVLEPSSISMTLDSGTLFGRNVKVKKAVKSSINRSVKPVIYRQEEVQES